HLSSIAVHDGFVYVTGYYTQQIHRCPVSGCVTPSTLTSDLRYPTSVRIDGANVFWVDADRASVGRCPLPTCAGGPTFVASGPATWSGLALDDERAYWLGDGPDRNYTFATLHRARKDLVDGGADTLASDLPRPRS